MEWNVAGTLWRKELQDGRHLYVDIYVGFEYDSFALFNKLNTEFIADRRTSLCMKDSRFTTAGFSVIDEMRKHDTHWDAVICQANKSLCLAETGCKTIGMAYGCRAMLFFKMKEYSLCLNDIALAHSHGYPAPLWSNLQKIRDDCVRLLDINGRDEPPSNDGPQLSFPANATIPCFAEGLEVKQSEEFGKHVITNRDLEIGQTVIIEEAYCIASENNEKYSHCANCFSFKANLIPCRNCSAVMFCSQNCYDVGHERFHDMECRKPGVYTQLEGQHRLVMRTVIKAIKSFSTVEELMDAIDRFNQNPHSEPNNADPSIRAYMQFFGLTKGIEQTPIIQNITFIDYAKTIHSKLAMNPASRSLFRSLETSRFFAHLILHHIYVISINGVGSLSLLHGAYKNELGTDEYSLSGIVYARGIYLNSSKLNHSCQPNIARIFMGNKLIGKVIRPIKQGEQLFVTYM